MRDIDLPERCHVLPAPRLGIYRLKAFARLACGAIVEVNRAGTTWSIRRRDGEAGETRLVAIGPTASFSPEATEAWWLDTLG